LPVVPLSQAVTEGRLSTVAADNPPVPAVKPVSAPKPIAAIQQLPGKLQWLLSYGKTLSMLVAISEDSTSFLVVRRWRKNFASRMPCCRGYQIVLIGSCVRTCGCPNGSISLSKQALTESVISDGVLTGAGTVVITVINGESRSLRSDVAVKRFKGVGFAGGMQP
jgi:hypothetical protein